MTTAAQTSPATGGFTEAAFTTFLDQRGEPSWLVERRRAAFAAFQAAPWPTLRDEEWRRTDIRPLKLANFAPPGSRAPSDAALSALAPAWDTLRGLYSAGIEHIDSVPARRIGTDALPKGVILTDLTSAITSHPHLIEEYLARAARSDIDVFSALHAAFWTGGTLLYVPRNVNLEAPVFNLIGMSAEGNVDLSHTLIILEDGAEATFVQEASSSDRSNSPALHVGAVELFVGAGARLRFVNIQNWDAGTWHFGRERALVGRDGAIQWTIGGLGARLAKVNQETALMEQGAQAQVNGVMFTTARQHLAYFTRQDHVAPHTASDLLYKAALKGSSRIVWKGMIRVEKDAQKTNAYQKNDNLILTETARADSIPGLEIEANDVRCSHGATAGRVDEEMIFYLQSRGIQREEAMRLIIEGFFANVFDRITLEPVREVLRQAVAAKLIS